MVFRSLKPVGLGRCAEAGIFRVKRQRNEGHEAVRSVLHRAQLEQMIDALFVGLDVAVEHGGVRAQADLVRGARDFEPLLAADFVVANDFAHARIENFRAAAGQRIDAGILSGPAAYREWKAWRCARSSRPRPW